MNNFQNKNLDGLLNAVSKKLNMPPEKLKTELQEGKFDNALRSMSPQDAAKLNTAMQNPQLIEQMMSSPQAQALYKKLTGGG